MKFLKYIFLLFLLIILLSFILLPLSHPPKGDGKLSQACRDVYHFHSPVLQFWLNRSRHDHKTARFPKTEEGFLTIVKEKILSEIPIDPWGNPYHYLQISKNEFKIISYGSDNKKGGRNDATDIFYHYNGETDYLQHIDECKIRFKTLN